MTRKDFIMTVLGLFGLSIINIKTPAGIKKEHTDFDYADVIGNNILSKNANPAPTMEVARREHIIPYLNGKPMKGVQRGSAVEGWLDVIVNFSRPDKTRRIFGQVQLLWKTPERWREFEKCQMN